MKNRLPAVPLGDLYAAYQRWPAPDYDKGALRALIIRIRIERAAETLPATVIAAPSDSTHLRRRLLLSVGEPGLDPAAQAARRRIVLTAIAAYEAICDLLHGRTSEPHPPLHDLNAWEAAVEALEQELGRQSSVAGSVCITGD